MRKFLNILFWVLFIAGVLIVFSFTEKEKNNKVCTSFKIAIDWEKGNQFINEKGITTLINHLGYKVNETKMENINTQLIESKIMDLSSVEEVSVFKNIDATLEVNIIQREPIARIFNQNGNSFYLDDKGKTMPLETDYTARVIVVNGNINEKNNLAVSAIKQNDSLAKKSVLDDVYDLVTEIRKDKFLEAQFEQIYIEQNGEFTLVPKVGNQLIIMGKPIEIKQKLNKLKTFYFQGINPENLNLYETINLKYNKQIVCTKK